MKQKWTQWRGKINNLTVSVKDFDITLIKGVKLNRKSIRK